MSEEKDVTPTDLLIEVAEDGDNIEDILILYTGKDGMMYWKSNRVGLTKRVGLCESAKYFMLRNSQE